MKSTLSPRRLPAVLLALLSTAALVGGSLLAAPAPAAAPSRAEYVVRLESICKPRSEATQRAMKGIRADVRAERWKVAAAKFARGTRIFSATVSKMSPVPRPDNDRAKLKNWFEMLSREEMWLRRITAALRGERAIVAQRDTAHFIHSGNLANNVVIAFGFNYCRFKFSRYG